MRTIKGKDADEKDDLHAWAKNVGGQVERKSGEFVVGIAECSSDRTQEKEVSFCCVISIYGFVHDAHKN